MAGVTADPIRIFNDNIRAIFDNFASIPSQFTTKGIGIKFLRESMLKGMSSQPEYAIEVFGPYILECKGDIERGNYDRILRIDHAPYIISLSKLHSFDATDAATCVAHMKYIYQKSSPEHRLVISGHCKLLLSSYAQYRLIRVRREESKG